VLLIKTPCPPWLIFTSIPLITAVEKNTLCMALPLLLPNSALSVGKISQDLSYNLYIIYMSYLYLRIQKIFTVGALSFLKAI
jgi:hypothetical protein